MKAILLRRAVGALAILVTACGRGSGDVGPPPSPMSSGLVTAHRLIEMEAILHATTVSVTNRNDFAWRDCNVQINVEEPEIFPFEHPVLQRLPAGAGVVLDLSSFTRDEGPRVVTLDPQTLHELRGKKLILGCETPKGRGFSEAEFGRLQENLPYGAGVEIGIRYEYLLYTHCGVLAARIDGREWDADPPLLDDVGANPPPGWGNPFDRGTMVLLASDVAEFRSASGKVARFRPRPPGGPGPGPCE